MLPLSFSTGVYLKKKTTSDKPKVSLIDFFYVSLQIIIRKMRCKTNYRNYKIKNKNAY